MRSLSQIYLFKQIIIIDQCYSHSLHCTMVDIHSKILEKLQCCECGELLSYAPIMMKANGESICGRCTKTEETLLRNKVFEEFAVIAAFPCRYRDSGCPLTVPWEHVILHEDYCDYRPIECPVAPSGSCKWKEPQCNLLLHYQEEHPGLVLEPPCVLNTDITCDNDKNILLSFLNFVFLVQIRFDKAASKMWHCIQCFSNPKITQQFRFKILFRNEERNLLQEADVISEKCFTMKFDKSVETDVENLLNILGDYSNIICTISILPKLCIELKNMFICKDCKDESRNAMFKFNDKYYCSICAPSNSLLDQYYEYLHKLTLKTCENNYYKCSYLNINKKMIHKHQIWDCKRQTKCYFGCEVEIEELKNHYKSKNCRNGELFSCNDSYIENTWYHKIIEKDDSFICKFRVTDSILEAYVYSNLPEEDIANYDVDIIAIGSIILEHNLIEEYDWEINTRLKKNIVDGRGRYRFNDIHINKKNPSVNIEIQNL